MPATSSCIPSEPTDSTKTATLLSRHRERLHSSSRYKHRLPSLSQASRIRQEGSQLSHTTLRSRNMRVRSGCHRVFASSWPQSIFSMGEVFHTDSENAGNYHQVFASGKSRCFPFSHQTCWMHALTLGRAAVWGPLHLPA